MNIGNNIEAIRKEKGLTQSVVAEKIGIKQATYSEQVNPHYNLTISRLKEIADALEVSVVDIITYPEHWVPETGACRKCAEKDKIIANLNKLIEVLENRPRPKQKADQ